MAAGAATAGLLTAACSSSDSGNGQTSVGPDGAAVRAARTEKALRSRSADTSRVLLARYDAVRERHPGQEARLAPLRDAVARHITVLTPEAREEEAPKASGASDGAARGAGDGATHGARHGASGGASGGAPYGANGASDGAARGTDDGATRAPEKPSATSGPSDSPGSSGRTGAPGSSAAPASITTPDAGVTAAPQVPADPAAALKDLAAAERRTCDAHTATLMEAPPELARLLASLAAASAGHAYLLTEGARP
ncbi:MULTISPECIES: hypothetical protein [unclassified Streptomyces]|uniref:hypothetical protein n=1 Tax=unclassified Streptomyces TaxID=2593676 RepID=UPI0038209E51